MFPLPFALRLFLSASLLAAGACSSKNDEGKQVYPVRGQVLMNKKPAAGAFVLFVPVNEPVDAKDPRPRAEVEDDGSFTLTTYKPKDGAPPGEYIVLVTWQGPADQDEREDRLQGRYNDAKRPQFRATVKQQANELPPFHLK